MVNEFGCCNRKAFRNAYLFIQSEQTKLPYSPVSQVPDALLPVTQEATEIKVFRGNFKQLALVVTLSIIVVDSQLIDCNRFSHWLAIRIP